jgi:hypothetical protein
VAGCCECGDEPSGSCATELVSGDISKWISKKEDVEVWTDYEAQGAIQRQDAVSSHTSCGQYHD